MPASAAARALHLRSLLLLPPPRRASSSTASSTAPEGPAGAPPTRWGPSASSSPRPRVPPTPPSTAAGPRRRRRCWRASPPGPCSGRRGARGRLRWRALSGLWPRAGWWRRGRLSLATYKEEGKRDRERERREEKVFLLNFFPSKFHTHKAPTPSIKSPPPPPAYFCFFDEIVAPFC